MKRKSKNKPRPFREWMKGDYENPLTRRFFVPYQLLMICRITDTPPFTLLSDFAETLSAGSFKREGRDEARELLIEYFLLMGYGQHRYSPNEIRQVFSELNSIGSLFPKHSSLKMVRIHSRWREQYHDYWFHKWYNKDQRPPYSKTKHS